LRSAQAMRRRRGRGSCECCVGDSEIGAEVRRLDGVARFGFVAYEKYLSK
jgi:hypothetical protein